MSETDWQAIAILLQQAMHDALNSPPGYIPKSCQPFHDDAMSREAAEIVRVEHALSTAGDRSPEELIKAIAGPLLAITLPLDLVEGLADLAARSLGSASPDEMRLLSDVRGEIEGVRRAAVSIRPF